MLSFVSAKLLEVKEATVQVKKKGTNRYAKLMAEMMSECEAATRPHWLTIGRCTTFKTKGLCGCGEIRGWGRVSGMRCKGMGRGGEADGGEVLVVRADLRVERCFQNLRNLCARPRGTPRRATSNLLPVWPDPRGEACEAPRRDRDLTPQQRGVNGHIRPDLAAGKPARRESNPGELEGTGHPGQHAPLAMEGISRRGLRSYSALPRPSCKLPG